MNSLLKKKKRFMLWGLLAVSHVAFAEPLQQPWSFKGQYLISASDADMVASAYVDGKLGPKEGSDQLSIIDLSKPPQDYAAIEVPASNSVAGPPAVLAVDSAGNYAYVIETFTPRPDDDNDHTFRDLSLGELLTVYDIRNKQKPKLVAKHQIKQRPDAIDISPDGQWLIISYHPGTPSFDNQPLGLYQMNEGQIQAAFYPEIPNWDYSDRLISLSWHPNGEAIALINETAAEVSFYTLNDDQTLTPWGNKVSVGKSPFIGRFTDAGKHYLVNNLYWGDDVSGRWNEAPNGTIVNIAVAAEQVDDTVRHALSSQVMVRPSPEGFAVSPNGEWVVAANMERSWLPYDDARQSWFSSLTLIQRDPKTGAMNVMATTPYDGILPEAVVFDSTGESFAVATYDYYDTETSGGAIDFFRIVADPLNTQKKMVMQIRKSVPVTRGPHSMLLIK